MKQLDNYSYPIDPEWSREEMIAVIDFLNLVEQANEGGVDTQAFLVGYQKFKQVIRSIGEEKKLDVNLNQLVVIPYTEPFKQLKKNRRSG